MIEFAKDCFKPYAQLNDFLNELSPQETSFFSGNHFYTLTLLIPRFGHLEMIDSAKISLHPLVIVAILGKVEHLKILLRFASDKVKSEHLLLAFTCAAANGCLDIVKELLTFPEISEHINERIKNQGEELALLRFPALMQAAAHGHLSVVNELLTYKNLRLEADYFMPLALAMENGHASVLQALLNVAGTEDLLLEHPQILRTAALEAGGNLKGGYPAIIIELLNHKRLREALFKGAPLLLNWCLRYNRGAILRELLEDKNFKKELLKQNRVAEQAFFIVVQKNNIELLQLLLDDNDFKQHIPPQVLSLTIERTELERKHIELAEHLLRSSAMMKRIITEPAQYTPRTMGYINQFLSFRVDELAQKKITFEKQKSVTVFNITDKDQAQWWYYVLRYYANSTPKDKAEYIKKLLLSIPSVQQIAKELAVENKQEDQFPLQDNTAQPPIPLSSEHPPSSKIKTFLSHIACDKKDKVSDSSCSLF